MSQDDNWEFKALKKIDSIPVEGKLNIFFFKQKTAYEIKRLVSGRSCSLQRQALPKDKTKIP